jgi:amidophosphoribosyltransferase
MLCGNFNLTNTAELNDSLIAMGQHPIFATDTQAILEKIGFFLDEEHEDIYRFLRTRGLPGAEISRRISEELDLARVLTARLAELGRRLRAGGLIGNGDAFVARDPSGIRPCHWFQNDEVVAFASERAPLMTVFDLEVEEVKEVEPGHVVVIKKRGTVTDSVHRAAAARVVLVRAHLFFPRQRPRHLPRAQGARRPAGRPGDQVHRRRLGTPSSASSPTPPRSPTTA